MEKFYTRNKQVNIHQYKYNNKVNWKVFMENSRNIKHCS